MQIGGQVQSRRLSKGPGAGKYKDLIQTDGVIKQIVNIRILSTRDTF